MSERYILTSLTRISNIKNSNLEIVKLPKSKWKTGDYIASKITFPGVDAKIELHNGRMMDALEADKVVSALGVRAATLEATGSWRNADPEKDMHLLTGAGLTGLMTSRSVFSPDPIRVRYLGHVLDNGQNINMRDMVKTVIKTPFNKPVVLLVGTSMSAGKTTTGRLVTNQLKLMGLKVIGAKVTGAGRYRDILALEDAGADEIIDFVDAGLPSTVCSKEKYNQALDYMLSRMGSMDADVAVIEIGASPLEPYNGHIAMDRLTSNIKCIILCASDPYAVYGVMKSYNFVPDLVGGPATNTLAAIELSAKLSGVDAVNLLKPKNIHILRKVLTQKLNLQNIF